VYIIYIPYMGVTTIRLHEDTKERLTEHGGMHDSYDDVVRRLLDEAGTGGT
jgi:hypothetical protein